MGAVVAVVGVIAVAFIVVFTIIDLFTPDED